MVDKLVEAIGQALGEKWGDLYEVYTEKVYQNVKKPCFFAECTKIEKINMLGERFFLRAYVTVTVENDSDTQRREIEEMATELFKIMSRVCVDNVVLFGKKLGGKREKGSFVINGCYDIFTQEKSCEKALMETIEVKEN